jgi:hypothetical protein
MGMKQKRMSEEKGHNEKRESFGKKEFKITTNIEAKAIPVTGSKGP